MRSVSSGRHLPDGRIDPQTANREWEERTLYPAGPGTPATAGFVKARAVREYYQARFRPISKEGRVAPFPSQRSAASTGIYVPDDNLGAATQQRPDFAAPCLIVIYKLQSGP